MLAVIKAGGKQYLVSPGKKIRIEKIEAQEGEEVTFPEVLLLRKEDGKTEIGKPLVKSAKVKGKVIQQGKGDKMRIFKYKPKKHYKVKKGHRQPFTEVEISSVS